MQQVLGRAGVALGLVFHGDKRALELKSLIHMPTALSPHSWRSEEPLPSLLHTLSGPAAGDQPSHIQLSPMTRSLHLPEDGFLIFPGQGLCHRACVLVSLVSQPEFPPVGSLLQEAFPDYFPLYSSSLCQPWCLLSPRFFWCP